MPRDRLPKNIATSEVGTSGLKNSGGEIIADPLNSLHGEKGIKLYHEMSTNSSVIGAIRFLIRNWIMQADWHVNPADDSEQAKSAALFTEECMHDMTHSWVEFIGEALTMIDFGWSWHEVIYKIRRGDSSGEPELQSRYTDGKIGWQKMPIRGQLSWWRWAIVHDRLVGMIQNDTDNAEGQVLIPVEKSIHFRTESTYNNPEGRSLYRNAVLDWFTLKRIQEYEAISIERDLAGLPVMHVPFEVLQDGSTANSTILPYLETSLAQLKRDERAYLILPPRTEGGVPTGYEFELQASPGRHQIDTVKVKQQYRANILQSVLAQFLEFGVAQHGSFSLSSSATSNFAMALGGIMDTLAGAVNCQAIPTLMRLNNVPQQYWPVLAHGDIETPDLKDISNYVLQLSNAGLDMTDERTSVELRRLGNLPPPPEVDECCG
jgi:hypothetical protein